MLNDMHAIPFTLAVDFVLTEGDILQLVLTVGLADPAADVIVGRPPEQIGDQQRRHCIRIGGPIIVFLAFHALCRCWRFTRRVLRVRFWLCYMLAIGTGAVRVVLLRVGLCETIVLCGTARLRLVGSV